MNKLIIRQWTGILIAATVFAGTGLILKFASIANAAAPQKIIVGTGFAFKPYCYLDDQGKLAGFEYEVLKAVDQRLPQYEFEYQTMDFPNVLLSLESGKIDLASHQYAKNPEREKKYLYANEYYTVVSTKITVLATQNGINSIADLSGKKVQVSPGGNDAYSLEKYNNEHGNKIKLVYGALDTPTLIQSLKNGSIDATTQFTRNVDAINKSFGGEVLKTVGKPLYNAYTYHIFRKDEVKLRNDVDKALRRLKKDGTLAKLSIKILGKDYTR